MQFVGSDAMMEKFGDTGDLVLTAVLMGSPKIVFASSTNMTMSYLLPWINLWENQPVWSVVTLPEMLIVER